MKKILIALIVLVCSVSAKAQFSNTDTLRAFINRWIRNSAVEAFQNLRLNTALIGMTNFLDSAYGGQVVSFVATNDTTLRIITVGGDTLVAFAKGRNLNLQQVCTNGSTLTTNFTITLQDSLKITSGDVVIDSLRLPALATSIDTTTYKPLIIDASGNVSKMTGWPGSGGGNLDATLALGGRLSADRSVSMGHKRWDLDSAALRLRNVDSASISIDLAKAGSIMRFNKPEGVARTYPGSTPFKFIMENSTDDEPTERNNPVKWGWNINRADSTNAAGIWYSMEPNYRPGGARWLENHLEVSLPNGTLKNSRLFSSTFTRGAGDSIESSTNTWDFRGNTFNCYNLTSTIGYFSAGVGTLNVTNSTAGSTDLSITNGLDVGHFNLAPGTQIVNFSGLGFQVTGNLNTYISNTSSSEREGIRFVGDAGTTGYLIKHNGAYPTSYLQNAMMLTAANAAPYETALTLKPDGTSWLGDITAYNTGSQKVNVSGSLALRGLPVATSATYILGKNTDSSVVELTPASLSTLLGGITSINSQTGPSITISGDATNGISVSAATNTVTVTSTTDLESFGTDANNTGTGETDLYSHTLAANKLTLNGKAARFRIVGTNNDATATAQIKGYFAGTNIFDSGALTMSAAGDWLIEMEIQRTTSTTAAATVTFSCANTTVTLPVKYTALTSQDWTTTNIFKITGTAGGGGGGSNDITAHAGKVVFVP